MLYGMFFAMSFALVRGYHDPAFAAGLRLTVIPVALGFVAPFGGAWADERRRLIMAGGMMVCLASALALTALLTGTPESLYGVMAALAAFGAGLGLYIAPNNNATIGAAPADKSGVAGGLLNLLRVFGRRRRRGGLNSAGMGAACGDRRCRAHNACGRSRAALGGRRGAGDARDFSPRSAQRPRWFAANRSARRESLTPPRLAVPSAAARELLVDCRRR